MKTSENLSTCQRILQNHTEKELRKFHAEKIRELRKDGFCLDNNLRNIESLGDTRHFLDFVDDIRKESLRKGRGSSPSGGTTGRSSPGRRFPEDPSISS